MDSVIQPSNNLSQVIYICSTGLITRGVHIGEGGGLSLTKISRRETTSNFHFRNLPKKIEKTGYGAHRSC